MEQTIQCAIEKAFANALDKVIQEKVSALFEAAFSNGTPFGKKLQDKIEEGFQRFIEEGIRWEKKKPGFRGDSKKRK